MWLPEGHRRDLKLRLVCIHRTPTVRGRPWMFGQPCLSSFMTMPQHSSWITSLLHWSAGIACVKLTLDNTSVRNRGMHWPFPELTHLWLEARRFGDEDSELSGLSEDTELRKNRLAVAGTSRGHNMFPIRSQTIPGMYAAEVRIAYVTNIHGLLSTPHGVFFMVNERAGWTFTMSVG
jgi:hypothetical protein